MTQWIDIGPITAIPVRGARVIKTAQGCVAVFRTTKDEIFAVDDRCPHKGGPLSEGIVHGASVTCPLHNWVFDLATGMAKGADQGQIGTYPLRVEGGRMLLDVTYLAKKDAA
ncbi:nitrite reductase small subunit NirD [Puniceibacterium sp. IMCC21224]|uniref:nitrite reductase small subunit NirD n=1 Tax=Puniceibacterium sp. IMCC21224 TaxID=1618204 RepID=UPI00064D7B68|nr:nitrite reductase small subunit NirD [Puniceibacterium sp. IMCC21224]KMK68011.1 NAD(P)H-dependent nitrite reductase, small subunit [Puniceibacterium sp. IMCC21224]